MLETISYIPEPQLLRGRAYGKVYFHWARHVWVAGEVVLLDGYDADDDELWEEPPPEAPWVESGDRRGKKTGLIASAIRYIQQNGPAGTGDIGKALGMDVAKMNKALNASPRFKRHVEDNRLWEVIW